MIGRRGRIARHHIARHHPARKLVMIAALATVSLLAGCAATSASSTPAATHTPSEASGATHVQDPASPAATAPAVAGLTVARIRIPSIGVDAPTEQLTRDASGALNPPRAWQSAGWYKDGVLPGRVGPAVIAGHIDSGTGPAVFLHLGDLQPGARVDVTLSNRTVVSFVVDRSIDVSKGAFPTQLVYGPVPTPQLRLITCTGTFDPAVGHYEDNLVVFAHLAS